MRRQILWIGMLIILISFVNATTITENEITITSDKDTYFCEPIYNQYGECLIRAKINVTNERNKAINLDGLSTFSNSISDLTYISSNGVIPQQAQDKIPQELFLGGESKIYELQFYIKENGKFNYSVNLFQLGTGNLIATTTLDPFYNITINATTPNYLLTYGICMNESVFEFENQTDITTEISDGLDSTHYSTFFASMPNSTDIILNGWSFNQPIFSDSLHSYSGELDGQIYGSLDSIDIDSNIGNYYGGYFDGTNDYIRFLIGNEMDIPDLHNFTICVALNTTLNAGGDIGIITKGLTGNDGIFMRYKNDETIDCEFDGNTGSVTASSTTEFDDDVMHTICCNKVGDSVNLWVDGVQEDTASANIGNIINSNTLFFGSEDLGVNKFTGTIRQIGLFNGSLSNSVLSSMGTYKSIADLNKGQAIHVYFNHSFIVDDDNKNYLAIESDVQEITTIRVMSYENMTYPNSTNFITEQISSGVSFVSLDSLLNTGYNNPLRFWDLEGRQDNIVDEVYLIVAINDTTNPNITNCQVNTTSLSCDESVRLQCDVTDDGHIYQVWYGTNFSGTGLTEYEMANNNNGEYYLDKTITGVYHESKILTWYLANATDLGGNYNETLLNLDINYTCLSACVPDWQQNIGICQINDSRLVTYTDNNNCGTTDGLPVDNGTYILCNYCTEDVEQVLGTCLWNGTGYYQDVTYQDNNYYSCCAISGIASDCTIETYPYNETTKTICNSLEQDFDVQLDDIVYFGWDVGKKDRVYGKVYINGSEEYSCVSYVKTPYGKLIQSNPVYEAVTNSALAIVGKSYEDRAVFQTTNGLVNVYWTKENVVVDGSVYVFGVECSSNASHKISEKAVNVLYESVSTPTTRFFWLNKDGNLIGLMIGLLGIFFIAGIIGLVIYQIWGRGK